MEGSTQLLAGRHPSANGAKRPYVDTLSVRDQPSITCSQPAAVKINPAHHTPSEAIVRHREQAKQRLRHSAHTRHRRHWRHAPTIPSSPSSACPFPRRCSCDALCVAPPSRQHRRDEDLFTSGRV